MIPGSGYISSISGGVGGVGPFIILMSQPANEINATVSGSINFNNPNQAYARYTKLYGVNTVYGQVNGISVTPGSGYTIAPTAVYNSPTYGAISCSVSISGGRVTSITLPGLYAYTLSGGPGTVTVSGGNGAGAGGSPITANAYQCTAWSVTNGGAGYLSVGSDYVLGSPSYALSGISITNGGSGYTNASASISGGSGASSPTVYIGYQYTPYYPGSTTYSVTSATVTNQGSKYSSAPTIGFSGGGGSGAVATAVIG